MSNYWRQFRCLLHKDWILMKRNKIWTFFELVIPFLIIGGITYLVYKSASISLTPETNYKSFVLKGTIEDVFVKIDYVKSIRQRWCTRNDVFFGYTTTDPTTTGVVKELMKNVEDKFKNSQMMMTMKEHSDEHQLLKILKEDMPMENETYCAINKYAGGVIFDKIDLISKQLKFRLLIGKAKDENWNLAANWDTPYGAISGRQTPIPNSPPYWSSGYLTIQHAIETTFIETSKGAELRNSDIEFKGLPEPKYKTTSVSAFISFFPSLWSLFTFINVVHITREIAAENGSVKPYLTAMGLSTPMFYLSHIFVALLKFIFSFSLTIFLVPVLEFVSPAALLLPLFLFGIGALVFGAFVASFFDNTNSAIKVILVVWGGMILSAHMCLPRPEQTLFSIFYGLINIVGSFSLSISSISDYMSRERELNLLNMFNDSTLHFSLGWSIVLMIINIIVMFSLTLIVDHIRKSADFSIRNCLSWRKNTDEYDQIDGTTIQNTRMNEQMNTFGQSSSLQPPNVDSDALLEDSNEQTDGPSDKGIEDITVDRLVKIWSTTGEKAVDGLSLKAKRGQVSILLGHNGAGKSTTFSSIAGIIKPTQGKVLICQKDMETESDQTRAFIGLCPQYNPLYEKLTVEEHLNLIRSLKGATEITGEMDRLLTDVKLDFKKNELAMNLSGGMKRKLCVCLALIGGSRVVLLDEPTAGMDPGARRDVQDLLEREKKNRTILLTTHYMDEAERLGDWILIMSHGRLVSSGTCDYLKAKFGTGYLLNVVLGEETRRNQNESADILVELCQVFVKGARRGELQGQQVEIVLNEDQKPYFVQLFKALEDVQMRNFSSPSLNSVPNNIKTKLANLFMTNFGLSLNTLEQVFITVGDRVEQAIASRQNSQYSTHTRINTNASSASLKLPNYDTQSSTKSIDSYQRLMNSRDRIPDKKGIEKVFGQVFAILKKRFLYTYRNLSQFIGQVIVPIILLSLVASLSTLKSKNTDQSRELTSEQLEPVRVVWRMERGTETEEAMNFMRVINKTNGFIFQRYSDTISLDNITTSLIGEMPPAGFGMTSENEGTYLFNMRAYHALPTLVNMINQARMMTIGVDNATIQSDIFIYARSDAEKNLVPSMLIDILLIPLLILIFAMVTSTFVMFLIEERTSKFSHQQFLTGMSPLTFYSVSLLYDALIYFIICLIFLILFVCFSWMTNHIKIVVLFWFLYFISCVPFIYAVSFLFSSPSKANVLLIIWQVVISGTALIAIFALFAILDIDDWMKKVLNNIFLFLLPSYAFGSAMFTINSHGLILPSDELMQWDLLGKNAVMMTAFGIVSFGFFVVLQFKCVRKWFSQVFNVRKTPLNHVQPKLTGLPICENVEKEKQNSHTVNPIEYSLVVRDLTKKFGKFTAVNELCLAVDRQDCFGLLGVNGAGKTTTFDILTGQAFSTSGEALIGGRDITEQIPIGYCPQFDALMLDFTGREVLELLAQMHGFSEYKKKADLVLECVGMLMHADKLVRYYSGGQKRKISVGVALLAPTEMIILDEPTAGIDPRARKEVWELLQWCRQHSNSAIMLTSHSMDECEALCTRIAVLNRGSLIAIGTSQELKSLYGNSYTVTFSINSSADRENICNSVSELLPNSVFKTASTNRTLNLKWQIPKEPGDKWSTKFQEIESIAKKLGVKDYIVSQSSLEETFLRLASAEYQTEQSDPANETAV